MGCVETTKLCVQPHVLKIDMELIRNIDQDPVRQAIVCGIVLVCQRLSIDIVADAQKAYCIRNGNAMMSSITGTGCQLSALTAAFVTANPGHPLEAAAAAVCAMGLAGETAHKRLTPLDGNSTYRNYIIDAIYNMTPDQLEEGANYEVR